MSQMLVGIDVSLKSPHVQFMDGEGTTLASFSVANDKNGADTSIKKCWQRLNKDTSIN